MDRGFKREEIKELQRRDPDFGIIYEARVPGVADSPKGGYKIR